MIYVSMYIIYLQPNVGDRNRQKYFFRQAFFFFLRGGGGRGNVWERNRQNNRLLPSSTVFLGGEIK